MSDWMLFLIVLTPFIGAGLIVVTGNRPNLRETISVATGLLLLAEVASLVPDVLAGETPGLLLATCVVTVKPIRPASMRFSPSQSVPPWE